MSIDDTMYESINASVDTHQTLGTPFINKAQNPTNPNWWVEDTSKFPPRKNESFVEQFRRISKETPPSTVGLVYIRWKFSEKRFKLRNSNQRSRLSELLKTA
jgi:hypothetical protein